MMKRFQLFGLAALALGALGARGEDVVQAGKPVGSGGRMFVDGLTVARDKKPALMFALASNATQAQAVYVAIIKYPDGNFVGRSTRNRSQSRNGNVLSTRIATIDAGGKEFSFQSETSFTTKGVARAALAINEALLDKSKPPIVLIDLTGESPKVTQINTPLPKGMPVPGVFGKPADKEPGAAGENADIVKAADALLAKLKESSKEVAAFLK